MNTPSIDDIFPNTDDFLEWIENITYIDLPKKECTSLKEICNTLDIEKSLRCDDLNFYAVPKIENTNKRNKIVIGKMGLLSLWFLCVATTRLSSIAGNMTRTHRIPTPTKDGTEAQLPLETDITTIELDPTNPHHEPVFRNIELAKSIIKKSNYHLHYDDWLPFKKTTPSDKYRNLAILIFERAISWILLHEIAHLHYKHQSTTTSELRKQQEYSADEWATKWSNTIVEKEILTLRKLSIGVVVCWLGIIDDSPFRSSTHPHGADRFWKLYPIDGLNDLDSGLEALGYIAKALFFSNETTEETYDTPIDFVSEIMARLNQKLEDRKQ